MIQICAIPANLSETNISHNSVTLSWDDTNNSGNYEIQFGTSNFTLGSGTILNSDKKSITISNLEPNTSYDYYVLSLCDVNNSSMVSSVKTFTTATPPVSTEFRATLSEMNLYIGQLKNLEPNNKTFEYELTSSLFTDYAYKQRLIALPPGTSMTFTGNGLPDFPDDTVISKTFYYNTDDRNESAGKTIIETRLLILKNGIWEMANYKWNSEQTEATLDYEGGNIAINYINIDGDSKNVNYKIPTNQDCFTCHTNADVVYPIGPKLRSMNFIVNGVNQLQQLTNRDLLTGLNDPATVAVLPNWQDQSNTLNQRARAYFDINCAHCHSSGGSCDDRSALELKYETEFENTGITISKGAIKGYTSFYNPGVSMPLIGTSMVHQEGYALIEAYVNSL
ncbi:fibronectin type III domain-containing protein [Gelidibacter sp. F63206]|uniref:fibronectin type III domain-containing protein n=1 Tax=Gelidibacter sp. F63206 TaxID=2926425 RepID=UPI001FF4531D|nr:fibronectin type III domain-containing protein [Gelidibacter sp. F63206]MCK0115199.1 fibronectin type III domain-containing protein [Gelidibacter sp. F63206]